MKSRDFCKEQIGGWHLDRKSDQVKALDWKETKQTWRAKNESASPISNGQIVGVSQSSTVLANSLAKQPSGVKDNGK